MGEHRSECAMAVRHLVLRDAIRVEDVVTAIAAAAAATMKQKKM